MVTPASAAALGSGRPPCRLICATRATALAGLGIAHRRSGSRDPESQAFIESWFGKLKERCVWRHEFETPDQPGR
jgi:transposase InsO family protein